MSRYYLASTLYAVFMLVGLVATYLTYGTSAALGLAVGLIYLLIGLLLNIWRLNRHPKSAWQAELRRRANDQSR